MNIGTQEGQVGKMRPGVLKDQLKYMELLQNNKLIECLRTEIEEEATKGHVVVKLFLQRGSK